VFYAQCWTSGENVPDRNGYVRLVWEGSRVLRHRLSFFLHYGYWPKVCRHTCDNPPCYNPTHLLDGTVADNNRDKVLRGRARGGGHTGNRFAGRNTGMPPANTPSYYREMRRRKAEGVWNAR
jgi:hypothetical protein